MYNKWRDLKDSENPVFFVFNTHGIRSMLLCKTGKFSVISKEPIYRQHSQMYFENLRKS